MQNGVWHLHCGFCANTTIQATHIHKTLYKTEAILIIHTTAYSTVLPTISTSVFTAVSAPAPTTVPTPVLFHFQPPQPQLPS